MAVNWNKKYANKVASCKRRGITFDLTLEQFKIYLSLPNKVCDYTGESFGKAPDSPSLERIDKHKGYSVDNCCMVTSRANQLKDVIVDEKGTAKLSLKDLEVMKVISEKIKYPEQLTSKYKQLMMKGETILDNKTAVVNNIETHSDIELVKKYIAFGQGKQVSFSKFKAIMSRKTCEVTKVAFEDGVGALSKVFITDDSSGNFTDDNTIAVVKCVAGVLRSGLNDSQAARMLTFIKKV